MSFDFSSVDFDAGDVSSDINVDSDSFDYGAETLTDSTDQVGDFAGNSDFVTATDPSSITDAPTSVPGSDFVGPPEPSAFGNAVDSLKDQAGSLADKAKDAAAGLGDKVTNGFDKLVTNAESGVKNLGDQITAKADSLVTNIKDQFSPENISKFATKTLDNVITNVQKTAVNLALSTANKALSTVVGPAAAATLTNGAVNAFNGPPTKGAKAVAPASKTNAPSGYQNEEQQNADNPIDAPKAAPSGYQNEAEQNADGNGGVPASKVDRSAANVGYSTVFNEEEGTYSVVNNQTGQAIASGLSEQQATLQAQDQTFIDAGDVPAAANANGTAVNYRAPGIVADPNLATVPASTAATNTANAALSTAAGATQGLIRQAQNQQTARLQRQTPAQSGDWRVRLSLAPNSNYLYNATDCGPVLYPLYNTQGVIFPYTPSIDTSYKANYSSYDLTHSNYRGYFYQNSYVDGINIKATFTAQDTSEANYLLAVIHFFRSVTKMFYGQDAERGSPPPLVFLSGLGDFQFNQHPCVVSQFTYSLPADVNYIRAQNVANNGTNQLTARNRQTTLNPISNAVQRLASLGQGIRPGALAAPFAPQGSLAANNPTYVPTKMEINLTLLPVQSRQQVSQVFSLAGFANGNQLKGGFW